MEVAHGKYPETTIVETQKKEHIQLVSNAIDVINKGTCKKIVLSRQESIDQTVKDPLSLFLRLASQYPSAFVYCWFHPEIGLWLGATPETLLALEGTRFKTMSLAGTQPYSNATNINWSSKEVEEQQLVTDFIKNQLEEVTEHLHVGESRTVQAGPLFHLRTDISGILKEDLQTVIRKLHPTPAICGLPVQKAKTFIQTNENYKRSFYTGFLGELNLELKKERNKNQKNVENNAYNAVLRASHLFVNLRCMEILESEIKLFVGGGITKDSIPENEWDETVNKAKVMKEVLRDI
ncbi:MAG: chorismate-binding protein [Psychroserpens sp.]|nr:chorismate-binding protein [Psychroserpens sp.]